MVYSFFLFIFNADARYGKHSKTTRHGTFCWLLNNGRVFYFGVETHFLSFFLEN